VSDLRGLTRRELLALGGAAVAAGAVAAGPASAQAPKRGGTITIRGSDPPHFDPMLTTNFKTHTTLSFTHSRLVKHKVGPAVAPGTFPIEGDLAESWTQPNETTYVFKLRRGVRWQTKPPVNGRELTAEDVRYSVERFQTITGNAHAYMLRAVDRVEAPDKYTVRFTLKEPFVWFLDMLANPMAVPVVARECVEKFGDLRKVESCVGSGPWALESYRPNQGLIYVRNPTYFAAGLPYIERIEASIEEDSASRMPRSSPASTTSATTAGTNFLEPDGYLYSYYMPGEPRNQSHVNDPVVADLIVRQRRTAEATRRRELIHETQRHLAKQQYYVQIHSGLTVAAWETALKNYAPNFGYDMGGRLTAAWLDR
jgi:ABC-type transport system substrate-binding protein